MKRLRPTGDFFIRKEGLKEVDCAGGIVARREGNQVLVALIKEDSELTDYNLPKGHVEGGETIEQAAFREVEEETGLTDIKSFGEIKVISRSNGEGTEWKNIHYFLFSTTQKEGVPTDPRHENLSPEWFLIDQLPEMYWSYQKEMIIENREKIKEILGLN